MTTTVDPLGIGRDGSYDGLVFVAVGYHTFAAHFKAARAESDRIRQATSAPIKDDNAIYVLTSDARSGFAITIDGSDLRYVFSLERGRGDALVSQAVTMGAETLDCFDGYLPTLYARHGFVEYAREANWTPGGPDVVFMAQPSRIR